MYYQGFFFFYLTKDLIDSTLKPLIDTLSLDDTIEFTPLLNPNEIQHHKFRFLQKKNTVITADELSALLEECLKI